MGQTIMKIKGLVLFLVAACFFSCGENKYAQRLDVVESVINERPDSALAIIKSIDTLSLKSNAIKARYSLLHAMALDKNYIDTTNVNVVLPAVNYYQKHGSEEERFKAYYYLGRIQYNANNDNAAAISYSKAEALTDDISDGKAKGLLYMAFADIYNRSQNIDKEEEYVRKGVEAFEVAGDVKHGNLSAGRLGILLYNRQEWDKADSLFSLGIERAREDTVAMSVFLSNYARMLVVRPSPDPEKAIGFLKQLSVSYKHPLSLKDYGAWAYAAALIGDESTCTQIENQLKRLDEPRKTTILNWLYRIEQHRGNYEKALSYLIDAKAYDSRLVDNLLSDPIGQALQSYYSSEALNSKREAHILRLQLSLVILGFCLLFLLSLGYFKQKKDKREKEMERLLTIGEEANKLLTQTNEDLQTTLEDLRKSYVSTYKDKFSAIGELCNAYMDSSSRTDKKDYIVRRVENLIAYISDDDKLHARFESQINKDLNNIVKHLKADLGDVDKKESRFICYCIVGFEPQMIASILNLSVSNVYTKKSRLKERIRGLDSPYKDEYLRML